MKNNNFPPLINNSILCAVKGEKTDRLPIWIMRQAGRYLPEFRAVREKYDFFEICRTPELACEITLQPIERFDLDAAIIFSDILVIPQALGMEVTMVPGVGPKLPNPLTIDDPLPSNYDVVKELNYVYKAISLTRTKLAGRVPLIGFSGAPWTLMTYMIEGGGSVTFEKSKRWLYDHSDKSHKLLTLLTDAVICHLVAQAKAGAQLLQVFESHGGALTPTLFRKFALPCLRKIAAEFREKMKSEGMTDDSMPPLILFPREAQHSLQELADCGYDVLGLDWATCPRWARQVVKNKVTLQGNLDPYALGASEQDLRVLIREMLDSFGFDRYIVNLGHGILPNTDPDKVRILIDEIRSYTQLKRS